MRTMIGPVGEALSKLTSDKMANYGLLYKNTFIESTIKHAKLRSVTELLESFDIKILTLKNCQFAGSVDAIFSRDGKHLWLGIGHGTSYSAKAQIDEFFDSEDLIVRPLLLIDKDFPTLESCFCLLEDGGLMWYPDAFDSHSRMIIESWYDDKIIVMSREQALNGNPRVFNQTLSLEGV